LLADSSLSAIGQVVQIAGVGFFFGFFTSLFLRCCPFAMIVLLERLTADRSELRSDSVRLL